MTKTAGRQLRVVPALSGQLSLDLPEIPTLDHLTESAASSVSRHGPVPQRSGQDPGEASGLRRLVPTRDVERSGPVVAARVPVAVWAVWDGEDVVGVYADESVARGDAAVLRPDAARAGHRGRPVDCIPLQVFTESQHTRR